MADSQQEIHALMERIRGGSQEAVRELLDRYGAHLLRVIRRRLARPLRSQFDSADFVQSVWASFFAVPLEQYHFESPEALLAFLADVACNKVRDAARARCTARKRNLNRVHSLDGSAVWRAETVYARQPTPSQVVMAAEEWDRLLRNQPPHYRRILVLLRQGHTHVEIAQVLRLNEKTVRRVIQRAFSRLGPEAPP